MSGSEFLNKYPCVPSCLWNFQFSTFWVLLRMNQGVISSSVLLRVLILFPCCLFIRLFCYVVSVPVFCSKIVLFPCNPDVIICCGIFACKTFSLFWNFMLCRYCFIMSQNLFSLSSFTCNYCLISLSYLFSFFFLFILACSNVLPLFYLFCLLSLISYLHFQSNLPCRVWISFRVL